MKRSDQLASTAAYPRWALSVVVLLSFSNSVAFGCFIFPRLLGVLTFDTGTDGYLEIATNVLAGRGFVYDPNVLSTVMYGWIKREPAYPLLLAGMGWLFGDIQGPLVLVQSSLNAFTCFLVFIITRRLFGWRTAVLAGLIYAFHPFTFVYVSRIANESLSGAMAALLCYALVLLFETLSLRRALGVGVALGAAVLARAIFAFLPLYLLPALVLRFPQKLRRAVGVWLVIGVCMAAALTPWAVRNYLLSGEVIPLTTMGAAQYFVGNRMLTEYSVHENTVGREPDRLTNDHWRRVLESIRSEHPAAHPARLEVLVDQELRRQMMRDISGNPLGFARKIAVGIIFVWFISTTTAKSYGLLFLQLPLMSAAAVGIYKAFRNRQCGVLALCVVIACVVVTYAAVAPFGRYSYVALPAVVPLAAYGIATLANGRRGLPDVLARWSSTSLFHTRTS